MNKHAYLIMAHNNWNILKLLFEIVEKIYDYVMAE